MDPIGNTEIAACVDRGVGECVNEVGDHPLARFRARDLHMVLGPPPDGRPVRFRVRLDGRAPGADRGVDVDPDGWGTISSPRMYQLIRQRDGVGDRTFQIEFRDSGARAYVFTFG